MLSWKMAACLAAGNTVVHKPAEVCPLTALKFAELALRAGIPNGVINIVTGKGKSPLNKIPIVVHQVPILNYRKRHWSSFSRTPYCTKIGFHRLNRDGKNCYASLRRF